MNASAVVNLDLYRDARLGRPTVSISSTSTTSSAIQFAPIQTRTIPIPKWEVAVDRRLSELLQLRPDWDQAGAKQIDSRTAEFASRLLHYVWPIDGPTPFIAPTCYGGIQFEWHLPDFEIEIEVVRGHHVEVLVVDNRNESERYFECKHDLTDLFEAAEIFLDRYKSSLHATAAA